MLGRPRHSDLLQFQLPALPSSSEALPLLQCLHLVHTSPDLVDVALLTLLIHSLALSEASTRSFSCIMAALPLSVRLFRMALVSFLVPVALGGALRQTGDLACTVSNSGSF